MTLKLPLALQCQRYPKLIPLVPPKFPPLLLYDEPFSGYLQYLVLPLTTINFNFSISLVKIKIWKKNFYGDEHQEPEEKFGCINFKAAEDVAYFFLKIFHQL